jgi:hypothetical protein
LLLFPSPSNILKPINSFFFPKVLSHFEEFEKIYEKVVSPQAKSMQPTVPGTKLFLSLEKLSNDDKGNALHCGEWCALLKVNFESQLDQVDVLTVEEVLK